MEDPNPQNQKKHVTAENAEEWAEGFAEFRKQGTTRISTSTVAPGVSFETPEGLKAEDEPCRIAFDSQGGVYPIRESVFKETYAPADVGPDYKPGE